MSFDTYKDNDNENQGNANSPYGSPAPQAPQNTNPYGYSASQPQEPQNHSPYGGYPAPQQPGPYGAPTGNEQNPFAFNQAPQAAPAAGGFNIFGLTWAKNIVPNPTPPASQKSVGLAYVLWFFLGAFGVHQFYLGNSARGLFNLALMAATFVLGLTGIPFGLIYTAYWIYEAVTLNDQTLEINTGRIRKSIL